MVQQSATTEMQTGAPRVRWQLWPRSSGLARTLDAERERWFLWLPVAVGAGVAAYFALPFEPWWALALLPIPIAALLRRLALERTVALFLTSALLAATCGFALAKARTEMLRAPVLAAPLKAAQVQGFVELVEPRPGAAQRLTLRVFALARLAEHERPFRVRVCLPRATQELKPGDAVSLVATLSAPPVPALPGDYDFARSAWFAGLGAVGFSRQDAEILPEAPTPPLGLALAAAIERVRQDIGQRITAALPGERGAIANALITGERGGISEATNQAFRDAGLYHILSISGLHMTIVAGAAFLLIRVLLSALPGIALRFPIKKWAAVGGILAALCYLLISGLAFATLRAHVMISIMFLAVLLDRPALALRNVAVAALAILVLWPESLLDAGFQMSFAAVTALVAAYEWLRSRRRDEGDHSATVRHGMVASLVFLGGIVLTTLIASAAVAPFGIYHFHNVQAYAVLANLIAIPVCNFLVMPAALLGVLLMPLGLESLPLWIMAAGIDALTWSAERVAGLPGAAGRVAAISTWSFALMVGGGQWLLLWGTRLRLAGVVAMLTGLLLTPFMARPDILVGRSGDLVAARLGDGLLSALPARNATFDLTRWLEFDGDVRPAALVARGAGWRCDALGCTALVKGITVAVAHTPAALADDCQAAAIVIMRFRRVRACASALAVVDRAALAADGATAIYVQEEAVEGGDKAGPAHRRLRIETVQATRGMRPWSWRPGDESALHARAWDAAPSPRRAQ